MENNEFEEGEILDSDEDASLQAYKVEKDEPRENSGECEKEAEPDPLDTYNVITRPSNEANNVYRQHKITGNDSDEDDNSAVSSDEDTDLWKLKKSKYFSNRMGNKDMELSSVIKSPVRSNSNESTKHEASFARSISFEGQEKRKKQNNIWGSVLTEQSLTQTMGSIGVERKLHVVNSYRDVEAYDYLQAHQGERLFDERARGRPESLDPFEKVIGDKTDNRKRNKRHHSKERDSHHTKRQKRYRTCNENDSNDVIIDTIVENLNEKKRTLIEKIINIIGKKKAIELMYATEDIEEEGGMFINDGSRRRTPGGVFIQLIKQDKDITKEMVDVIFADEQQKYFEEMKQLKKEKKKRNRQRKKEQSRLTKMLPQNRLLEEAKHNKVKVDTKEESGSESDEENKGMVVEDKLNTSSKSIEDDILNREEVELDFVLG